MPDKRFINLIKLILTTEPVNFDCLCFAEIDGVKVRLKDLTIKCPDGLGKDAEPLGHYYIYINPEINTLVDLNEFVITRCEYHNLFIPVGTVIDRNCNEYVVYHATTPNHNQWVCAARCIVDGNSVRIIIN